MKRLKRCYMYFGHLTAGTERKYNCFIPICECGNVRPLKEEDPMKRILSTILAVALLLGLGALAVLARGGGDILTPIRAAPVALAAAQPQTAAAPDAPATGREVQHARLTLDHRLDSNETSLEAYIRKPYVHHRSQYLEMGPDAQGAGGYYMTMNPGADPEVTRLRST